jgi:apolipoprotein N-acyltransferase
MAMVQAVRAGRSTLVDPTARVVAWESSLGREEAVLVGDLPIARPGTLYSRTGNWPVAVALLILARPALGTVRPR